MLVERLSGGPWGQNCFLVVNNDSALLIDPGGKTDAIAQVLADGGLSLAAILNTHGHFDHIGAVQALMDSTGAEFFISAREVPIMKTSNMLRFIFKSKEKVVIPTVYTDLDLLPRQLELGGLRIDCIETPGHTPGGYCFLIEHHLFSGDTVLRTMPGSAELPGGDPAALTRSLERLATLPGDIVLHPGHGEDTTLAEALTAISARAKSQRHPER
jgi:hydroxyacylglutathione hydrolase